MKLENEIIEKIKSYFKELEEKNIDFISDYKDGYYDALFWVLEDYSLCEQKKK